ncbi:unnamed protein product [Rotaria socialis]|uniref:N-acetyltransferase domain-containing protein n=1 Tax=Rotaria socialis TaxID=392032 RepID=A0A817SLD8_9BILA|nr:unnamed protein product [Rotaria socialis]CAF3764614.1 unnamed protein product [Rotaria socialis]CAF4462659.1 unnamed protein product [Rotaria socialis]CAF4710429.1 unnamed protein product [Rotaria socialis]
MLQLEKIIIRKAVVNDLPQMLQIMDDGLGIPTIDDEMKQRVEEWSLKLNNCSQFIFYVAEVDHGSIAGWCRGGRVVKSHEVVAQEMYDYEIQNIFIGKQYQHRGIGYELWKVLWNDVLLFFQPKNFVVWSVATKQAHQFYSRLGGEPKETRTFDEDCVSMAFVWNDLKLYENTNFLIFK